MKTIQNLILTLTIAATVGCTNGNDSIMDLHNDTFWYAENGEPILSQGGGIFRFTDPQDGHEKYFWYGVRYAEATQYMTSPKRYPRCTFEGVSLYTSENLSSWHKEPDVMTPQQTHSEGHNPHWLGRMGVAYIAEAKKFVLLIQEDASVLIATADSPRGPFVRYRNIDMTSRIGTPNTGAQTVFVDKDGRAYLVYSYGRGRNRGYISEIGIESETDSIGLKNCVEVFHGASREGNCMFRYEDKYYLFASNIYGWDGSLAYYLVSDSIYGPYTPTNNMEIMQGCEQDYAHISQTGFFFNVVGKEQETVVFCGDRWADFADNGLGYNQWTPITMDDDQMPLFNSLSHWKLDSKTGLWTVGDDNNYILNGSFEADRRIIPLAVKPRQEHILGWETKIISGTPVGVEVINSPKLNCFNSEADHKYVVGKMSMNISDTTDFSRTISQHIGRRGVVDFPCGKYTLTAKVLCSEGFEQMSMNIKSGDNESTVNIEPTEGEWEIISTKIDVSNNSADVFFVAKGKGGATCRIDDVSLTICKE